MKENTTVIKNQVVSFIFAFITTIALFNSSIIYSDKMINETALGNSQVLKYGLSNF